MFKIDCEMDLYEFDQMVGFWSGAKDRWDSMTEEEKEFIDEMASDYVFTSLTQVNDFIWFESDRLLEELREEEEEED